GNEGRGAVGGEASGVGVFARVVGVVAEELGVSAEQVFALAGGDVNRGEENLPAPLAVDVELAAEKGERDLGGAAGPADLRRQGRHRVVRVVGDLANRVVDLVPDVEVAAGVDRQPRRPGEARAVSGAVLVAGLGQ